MSTTIDHLVLAVPDLGAAVAWFAEASGVEPVAGGSHVGLGTRNALVSLGESYLEIVGPDPDQPAPKSPRPFGVDQVEAPRLVTFAVRPIDPDSGDVLDEVRKAGWDAGPTISMSRAKPDGELLSWQLALPVDDFGGAVPFFIDWGSTPNPATTSPTGATLVDLAVQHPAASEVSLVHRALGLAVPVLERQVARISASIETPKGRLLLR